MVQEAHSCPLPPGRKDVELATMKAKILSQANEEFKNAIDKLNESETPLAAMYKFTTTPLPDNFKETFDTGNNDMNGGDLSDKFKIAKCIVSKHAMYVGIIVGVVLIIYAIGKALGIVNTEVAKLSLTYMTSPFTARNAISNASAHRRYHKLMKLSDVINTSSIKNHSICKYNYRGGITLTGESSLMCKIAWDILNGSTHVNNRLLPFIASYGTPISIIAALMKMGVGSWVHSYVLDKCSTPEKLQQINTVITKKESDDPNSDYTRAWVYMQGGGVYDEIYKMCKDFITEFIDKIIPDTHDGGKLSISKHNKMTISRPLIYRNLSRKKLIGGTEKMKIEDLYEMEKENQDAMHSVVDLLDDIYATGGIKISVMNSLFEKGFKDALINGITKDEARVMKGGGFIKDAINNASCKNVLKYTVYAIVASVMLLKVHKHIMVFVENTKKTLAETQELIKKQNKFHNITNDIEAIDEEKKQVPRWSSEKHEKLKKTKDSYLEGQRKIEAELESMECSFDVMKEGTGKTSCVIAQLLYNTGLSIPETGLSEILYYSAKKTILGIKFITAAFKATLSVAVGSDVTKMFFGDNFVTSGVQNMINGFVGLSTASFQNTALLLGATAITTNYSSKALLTIGGGSLNIIKNIIFTLFKTSKPLAKQLWAITDRIVDGLSDDVCIGVDATMNYISQLFTRQENVNNESITKDKIALGITEKDFDDICFQLSKEMNEYAKNNIQEMKKDEEDLFYNALNSQVNSNAVAKNEDRRTSLMYENNNSWGAYTGGSRVRRAAKPATKPATKPVKAEKAIKTTKEVKVAKPAKHMKTEKVAKTKAAKTVKPVAKTVKPVAKTVKPVAKTTKTT